MSRSFRRMILNIAKVGRARALKEIADAAEELSEEKQNESISEVEMKGAINKRPRRIPDESDDEIDNIPEVREPRTKGERRKAGYLVEGDIFKMESGLKFYEESPVRVHPSGLIEFVSGEKETRRYAGHYLVTKAELSGGSYEDNWPDAWQVTAVKLNAEPEEFGEKGDPLRLPSKMVRCVIKFAQDSTGYNHSNPREMLKPCARAKRVWQFA